MSAGWRNGVKATLLASGHYRRRLSRLNFPGVAVLCYHAVRPDDWPSGTMMFEDLHVRASEFDAHCRLLADTCHPITIDQWRASLNGGPPLPPRPVLVTFDDGYRTVATVARPILQRYRIPAVLFVCAAPVAARTLFLHDAIARRSGEHAAGPLRSTPYPILREAIRSESVTVSRDDPQALVCVDELRMLAQHGFEIGNHTSSHAALSGASRQQQWDEIEQNGSTLGAWIGTPMTAFAYPFGQPEDYSADTHAILAALGYDFAFTTTAGFAVGHPGLETPRFLMLSGISAAELAHRLAYSWHKPSASRIASRPSVAARLDPGQTHIRTPQPGI